MDPISTQPLYTNDLIVSFPGEHIMQITLNRPKHRNVMTKTMQRDMAKLLDWFDREDSLRVAILTGQGRFFCAGTDLSAWLKLGETPDGFTRYCEELIADVNGLGAISRRSKSSKPIIAAVNGDAFGGGIEMIQNCDLVIASEDAHFTLPEAKLGVAAFQGGTPRMVRTAGHQRATEAFIGRRFSAHDAMLRYKFVNKTVPRDQVLKTALDWAKTIAEQSPVAVQSTKRTLILARQSGSAEEATVRHHFTGEHGEVLRQAKEKNQHTESAPIRRDAARL